MQEQNDFKTFGYQASFLEIPSQAKCILSILSDKGIRVSKSCRFALFIRRMETFVTNLLKSGAFYKGEDISILLEGMRDIFELKTIIKSEKVLKENKRELQAILGGTSIPSLDSTTKARDIQFQVYLAAIMDLSGLKIFFEEPDFAFEFKGNIYAVAAKRINSISKLGTRLSEAKDQILKSGHAGFIAFSLDRIVWNKTKADAYIIAKDPDILYSAGKEVLEELLKTRVKNAAMKTMHPKIVGHIASLTVPSLIPERSSFGVSSTRLFISFVEPDNPIYEDIRELAQIVGPSDLER